MNEQTPDDPQSPQHPSDAPLAANDPQPRQPETLDASSDTAATAQHDVDTTTPKRGRGIVKPILVGSAAAFVVLAVAGIGMSIADAVSDGDDEPAGTQPSASAPAPSGAPTPSASSDADDDSDDSSGAAAPSTPTDLESAIEAALRAAGGGVATSIDVEDQGWEVDVRLDDGSDVDVRVPLSGEPVVRADDDEDRSSDAPLDPARIAAISDAAIAAAGGGTVLSIETEDDGQVRFEVEVAQGDGDVDVELAEDLAVVSVDR